MSTRTRIPRGPIRGATPWLLAVLTVAAVTLSTSEPASAQKRIEMPKRSAGATRPDTVRDAEGAGPVVRLMGKAQMDAQGNLLIGKIVVRVSGTTGVHPEPRSAGRRGDLRSLVGQDLTVYGRRTAKGVDASLVILSGPRSETEISVPSVGAKIAGIPDPASLRIPGPDREVGEMVDGAPR